MSCGLVATGTLTALAGEATCMGAPSMNVVITAATSTKPVVTSDRYRNIHIQDEIRFFTLAPLFGGLRTLFLIRQVRPIRLAGNVSLIAGSHLP